MPVNKSVWSSVRCGPKYYLCSVNTLLNVEMARTDERSISRAELVRAMPCKEEEGQRPTYKLRSFSH